jgi:hypothetical protein
MANATCRCARWFGPLLLVVGLSLAPAAAAGQQPPQCSGPVTEDGVVVLMRGSVAESRVAWILTNCGLAFELSPPVEQRLKREGATDSLIATIRDLSTQRVRREAERLRQEEATQWTAARDAGTVAALDAYLARFPAGPHQQDARSRREALLKPAPVPAQTPGQAQAAVRKPVLRTVFRALHYHGSRVWDDPPCAGEVDIDAGGFVFTSKGHNFRFKRDDVMSITNNDPNPAADGWIRVTVRDGRRTAVHLFALLTDAGAPLPTPTFLESLEAVRAAAAGR